MRKIIPLILIPLLLSACAGPIGSKEDETATQPPSAESTLLSPSLLTLIPDSPVPQKKDPPNTFSLQVNPSLPPYDFKLITNPQPARLIDNTFVVGWVEVSQDGKQVDRIPVAFHDASQNLTWPQLGLRALDVNFDGYLDIATVERGGAEWGYYHWLQFDPTRNQFTFNSLTDDLSALTNNGMAIDPQTREILVYSLVATCASTYTYVNASGHLVLKQKEEFKQSEKGCTQVP
jgi:hypothetical protein